MNIWIHDLNDGSDRQLTSGSGGDYQPNWSPDGTLLVFFSSRSGTANIWTIELASGALTSADPIPVARHQPVLLAGWPLDRLRIRPHGRAWKCGSWTRKEAARGALTSVGVGGHFLRWTRDGQRRALPLPRCGKGDARAR